MACTCANDALPSIDAEFARYDAIFEGRVVSPASSPSIPVDAGYTERVDAAVQSIGQLTGDRIVDFAVDRWWKGAGTSVTVRTAAQRSACGFPFEPSRVYVVYASRRGDGSLWVTACGRTRPSDDAQARADREALDGYLVTRSAPSAGGRSGCATCAMAGTACASTDFGLAIGAALVVGAAALLRRRSR